MVEENVLTNFNTRVSQPEIDLSTYVHPLASVIGRVILGKKHKWSHQWRLSAVTKDNPCS